jgi:hypothetical protein
MPGTVEFGHDPEILAAFQVAQGPDRASEDEDATAMAAVYQQIADRRAQLEDADVLRRARSL